MTRVGFTGTQRGMTDAQQATVSDLLSKCHVEGARIFHHGDCIGADEQADKRARWYGYAIHLHPGPEGPKRAHCEQRGRTIVERSKAYLERNQDIVDAVDVLIAAPKEAEPVLRSGTWSTVRRARKKPITVYVVRPDGSLAP